MDVTDQVLSIFAGTRGHLDKIPAKEVHAWEEGFLKFIHEQRKNIWQKINDSRQLDAETSDQLDEAVAAFQKIYAGTQEKTAVA